MRAWQHMATYDDRGVPFSAWLYRIAHNLVANWHRDRSRRKVISLEDLSRWHVSEDGPEATALLAEDRAALLRAVRRLPADRQELLALKFVEHLSNAEIGGVMGRSEGAVKSLYHRTLMAQMCIRDSSCAAARPCPSGRYCAVAHHAGAGRAGHG